MSDMKRLLESMNKFAGEPEQKAGDQVRGTEKAKKNKDGKHPFLKRLVGDSKEYALKHKLIKEFDEFEVTKEDSPFGYKSLEPIVARAKMKYPLANSSIEALALYIQDKEERDIASVERDNDREDREIEKLDREESNLENKVKELEAKIANLSSSLKSKKLGEDTNPKDVIKVDVPLLIRLLEYAREDAKTDMDLHNVAERLINLSSGGEVLGMSQYDAICKPANEAIDPPTSQGAGPVNPGTLATANAGKTAGPAKPGENPEEKSPADLAKEKVDQQNLIKNLNQLKSIGVNVNPNQAQKAFSKADVGTSLNPTDKDTVSKLAPAVGDIIANPQLAGQFKSLVQKAQQQDAQLQKQKQAGA